MQVCDEGFEKKKRCVRREQLEVIHIIPGATDHFSRSCFAILSCFIYYKILNISRFNQNSHLYGLCTQKNKNIIYMKINNK